MWLAATVRAAALILDGGVFLVGIARLQGRLAPPDVVYVGLLLAAPGANVAALAVGYFPRMNAELRATTVALSHLVNLLLLAFVIRLLVDLPPPARREEALWLALLCAAPWVNALAVAIGWRGAVHDAG